MASKLLLRILTAARPGIQSGKLKMQDIVSEYFKQTGGKTIDPGERTIIENEFIEFAPSNVTTPDAFKGFLNEGEIVNQPSTTPTRTVADDLAEAEGVETAETILPTGNVRFGSNIDYDALAKQFNLNVEDIRGKNYQEIMEIGKSQNEGIGSMIPKEYFGYNRGKGGEFTKIPSPVYMDDIIASERPMDTSRIKNWQQRDDYAKFIRKMRGEEFENPIIRKIVKDSGGNIGEGKRAATTVARAAEMVADTTKKQEVLSELDEMKLDKGPRWWKGDDKYDMIEGPMGKDTRGEMAESIVTTVNNGVVDDLDILVGEDKTNELFRVIDRKQFKNDPDGFVQAVKEELNDAGIKYDMTFWENYVNEIMQLTTPEVSMFRYGGLV
jgi:hypothetical protein